MGPFNALLQEWNSTVIIYQQKAVFAFTADALLKNSKLLTKV